MGAILVAQKRNVSPRNSISPPLSVRTPREWTLRSPTVLVSLLFTRPRESSYPRSRFHRPLMVHDCSLTRCTSGYLYPLHRPSASTTSSGDRRTGARSPALVAIFLFKAFCRSFTPSARDTRFRYPFCQVGRILPLILNRVYLLFRISDLFWSRFTSAPLQDLVSAFHLLRSLRPPPTSLFRNTFSEESQSDQGFLGNLFSQSFAHRPQPSSQVWSLTLHNRLSSNNEIILERNRFTSVPVLCLHTWAPGAVPIDFIVP